MKRPILAVMVLWVAAPAWAGEDGRQLVKMPAAAQVALREEMLDFMAALHEIIGLLGEGKTAAAADVADAKLGLMAMGRHRGAPADASPGRHMPDAMHQQGRNLHIVANDFAKAARGGDLAKALAALQPVTGTCVSCHASYRIR
jgi:hypothetical protein